MAVLPQVFATVSLRSGAVIEYVPDDRIILTTTAPSFYQDLFDAVGNLRSYLAERKLHKGLRAARGTVHTIVEYLLVGGQFNSSRDDAGLDAGYYVTRACVPYDFVGLGAVAVSGPVRDVRPLRYYNQHVDGRAAFVAALEAGLTFSQCRDEDGHDAGFFIARCGDEELIALFERAGGVFRERELLWLGRITTRKVA
jgi:hypothetical protein